METSPKITKVWGSSWTTLWLFPKAHLSFEVSTSDSESSISTMAKRTWHMTRKSSPFFFLEGEVWTIQPPEVGGLHPKGCLGGFVFVFFFVFLPVFLCGWTRNIRLLIQDSVFLALKILETTFYKEILLLEEIGSSPVEVGSLSHYLQGFIHRW